MSDRPSARDADADAVARTARAARQYARRRYVLFLAYLAVGVAFIAVMIAGLSDRVARLADKIAGPDAFYLNVFVYFSLFSLAYFAATLPLTFYGEFVLEHRFGLSTQTFGRWARRRLKKWLVSFCLAAPLVLVLYGLLRAAPRGWWVPAAGTWLLVRYVLVRFGPRVLIPLFYRLEPIGDERLTARLTGLAEREGIRLDGVYRVDLSRETRKANAAVVGLGSTRKVVLGDTLLGKFRPAEIAVIFAHELGHIVHGHLLKGLLLNAVLCPASLFAASRLLAAAAHRIGVESVHDPRTLPLLVAFFAAIQLLVLPFGKWYSRRCELRSDAYALRVTGDREAFLSAMKKLGAMNLADVNPNRLAELLLFSHPPILKRIRFAEQLDLGHDA
jgi:STE24 endopeptidase